jgi:hypothetical protein
MGWRRAVTVGVERVFLGSMQRRRPGATRTTRRSGRTASGPASTGRGQGQGRWDHAQGSSSLAARSGCWLLAARGPCRVHQLPASPPPASLQSAPPPPPRASSKSTAFPARQCPALTRLRRPCSRCSRRRRPRADARHGVRTRRRRCMPAAIRHRYVGRHCC